MEYLNKIIKIYTIILCAFLCVLSLSGCGMSVEENISQNVSEYRQNFFIGIGENFSVTFTDGEREKDFIADGVKSPLVDFGVIVVKTNDLSQKKFVFYIGDEKIEGEFEVNPFDNSLVADICKKVSKDDNLTIEYNGEKVVLACLSKEWKVDYNKAFDIFVQKNKEKLKIYNTNNGFEGEIYIKIVSDKKDMSDIYYYVLCVTRNGDVIANLIDVKSGEILHSASK